jgi:hypothetical protein
MRRFFRVKDVTPIIQAIVYQVGLGVDRQAVAQSEVYAPSAAALRAAHCLLEQKYALQAAAGPAHSLRF